jgi:AcrR family transcriptional regulator
VYQRLEQAVLDTFSHSDFHKANIRDVANRAGVSFSTIYKHYGSKERLVFAFVDVWLGKLTERIYDHLQGIEDLKEKMRKVLWLQLDYYERNPGLARIIFMTLPMETWMADETFKQKKDDQPLPGGFAQRPERGPIEPACTRRRIVGFHVGNGAAGIYHVDLPGAAGPIDRPGQHAFRNGLACHFQSR